MEYLTEFKINNLLDDDINDLDEFSNKIYKIVMMSLEKNDISKITEYLQQFVNNYEKLDNLLNINIIEKKRIYYYGFLSALANLSISLNNNCNKKELFFNLSRQYKYLSKMLEFIEKKGVATGKEIQKHLKLKNCSDLSNFTKRIRDYQLIYISKIGNTNYYSLSPDGKLYLECVNLNNKKAISKNLNYNALYEFLDSFSYQIKQEHPNTFEVMYNLVNAFGKVDNNELLKIKIENIFISRESYLNNRLKYIVEKYSVKIDYFESNNQLYNSNESYINLNMIPLYGKYGSDLVV